MSQGRLIYFHEPEMNENKAKGEISRPVILTSVIGSVL